MKLPSQTWKSITKKSKKFKVWYSCCLVFTHLFFYFVSEQPSAATNCSRIPSLKEGENITCLCNGTNGNPPPTASWSKDGKVLSEEYLKSTLILTKVRKDDNGTYICKVRSHNLTDEEQVPVIVECECNVNLYVNHSVLYWRWIKNYRNYQQELVANSRAYWYVSWK